MDGAAGGGSDFSGGNGGIFIQRLDGERSEMDVSLPSICSLSSCRSSGAEEEAPHSQKATSEGVLVPGYHCSAMSSSTAHCKNAYKKVSSIAFILNPLNY